MRIPGHSEIEGNERADLEVKKIAINPTISRPFHHRPLKSARASELTQIANRPNSGEEIQKQPIPSDEYLIDETQR